jgi:hypothetical protein
MEPDLVGCLEEWQLVHLMRGYLRMVDQSPYAVTIADMYNTLSVPGRLEEAWRLGYDDKDAKLGESLSKHGG